MKILQRAHNAAHAFIGEERKAKGKLQHLRVNLIALLSVLAVPLAAISQTLPSRITERISTSSRATLVGSHPASIRSATDHGRTSASAALTGMKLVFNRSATQEAELKQLLATQQDRSSPLYHAWLTPAQFAQRFGMSDEDLSKAEAWLKESGFEVESVSKSRSRIVFSGTVAQAETAFSTEIHEYTRNGKTYFSPATDLSLPSALAGVVGHVSNLSSFRPHAQVRLRRGETASTSHFTSSQSGSHFLTPGDVRTIYDITPAYSAGYTGSGQSIAIVGQSAILTSDVEHFQSAAGLTVKDPALILVPNSGTSTVYTDDESESDLDLEYSGAIAPGAAIKFVYVGSSQNYSVTDSEEYAIDNNIAPIISVSYGDCESDLGQAAYASENAILEQAAAQGQTVIAASGDDGSSDCAEDNESGLAVDFPGSSQYVTSMGGSAFPAADVESSNTTFWSSSNGSDVVSSAKSYIPEVVWNESTTSELSAGGGGASTYTARPSWQTGVTGITSGTFRLVPDISLAASASNPGYLYCSSDTSTGVTGSCSNGFRDAGGTYLTVAGGTSFAAPIFSGMVALINQASGSSGQGVINAELYTLAANSATYASAFHDITTGTNACLLGYPYCSSAASGSYSAQKGYDEATGLGSVDLYNLLTAWSSGASSTSPLLPSTTVMSAQTANPSAGASDAITIAVSSGSASNSTTPTGTLSVLVDGSNATTVDLTSGSGIFTFTSNTAGTHTITATYSGDLTFAASTSSITVTIAGATIPTASFAISAANIAVRAGSPGTSAVTVAPSGGYTGTVAWTVSTSPAISNACYSITDAMVTGTAAATTTLTVYTSSSQCTSLSPLSIRGGKHAFGNGAPSTRISTRANPVQNRRGNLLLALAVFSIFNLGRFRRSGLRLACALVGLTAGLGISGCGGSGLTVISTGSDAAQGSYTVTLLGQDTASSSLKASTTISLAIQ